MSGAMSPLLLLLPLLAAADSGSTTTTTTPPPTTTSLGEFKCAEDDDNFCIPLSWACDGINDCGDQSDESKCFQGQVLPSREAYFGGSSSAAPPAACTSDEFKCQDYNRTVAACVPRLRLCDGHWDCLDGSDEGGFCGSCPRYGCGGECTENPMMGPTCTCEEGEVLAADNKGCLDVDECRTTHPCNHECVNHAPGYVCHCATGFALSADRKSCHLIEPAGGRLFVSYNHELKRVGLGTVVSGQQTVDDERLLSGASGSIPGLDYDAASDSVFLATLASGRVGSINAYHPGSAAQSRLVDNIRGIGNVAVDWVSRLIYFVASDSGRPSDPANIGLCTMDGRFCALLNLTEPRPLRPRGLVVHPRRGLVFWSDWYAEGPRIEAAGMDGSGRVSDLVVSKLQWPNALALDFASEKLYWADAQVRLIESLNLHTAERAVVIGADVHHPYDLAVFDNTVYWTDWAAPGVMASKLTAAGRADGHPWRYSPGRDEHLYYGLALDHPATHEDDLFNPCQDANCSHICTLAPDAEPVDGRLPMGGVKAVCLCPLGYSADPVAPDSGCLPDDDADWAAIPHMDKDRFDTLCGAGTACDNGGSCLPSWKREGVACECGYGFVGRFCEIDLNGRAEKHGLGPIGGHHISWVVVVVVVLILLSTLGALTGYYSRKWAPVKVHEEKLIPRIPSVSFFRRASSASLRNAGTTQEERQQIVHLEDGHRHLDGAKMDSFANPGYTGPGAGAKSAPMSPVSSSCALLDPTEASTHSLPPLRQQTATGGLLMKSVGGRSNGSGDDSGFDTCMESGEHNILG